MESAHLEISEAGLGIIVADQFALSLHCSNQSDDRFICACSQLAKPPITQSI